MTKEDILKRLRAGESADDIALEITDLLNEALQMKEKEDDYRKLYARKKADPYQSIVEDLASKVQEYSFSIITYN